MYLTINSALSFNGKREVLYGLKKGAEAARNSEICRSYSKCRRPLDKTIEQAEHNAELSAYIDMAVHDNDFHDVIKNMPKRNSLKKILAPQEFNGVYVEPMKLFTNALYDSMEKHKSKPLDNILKTFFANIKL